MTDLQILAVKRIRSLAEGMDIPMASIGYAAKNWTEEMIKEHDEKASPKWLENDKAQREIIEWAMALLKELK